MKGLGKTEGIYVLSCFAIGGFMLAGVFRSSIFSLFLGAGAGFMFGFGFNILVDEVIRVLTK